MSALRKVANAILEYADPSMHKFNKYVLHLKKERRANARRTRIEIAVFIRLTDTSKPPVEFDVLRTVSEITDPHVVARALLVLSEDNTSQPQQATAPHEGPAPHVRPDPPRQS